jgi:hypothetical protein
MLLQGSFWKRSIEKSTNLILGFLILLFSCIQLAGFSQATLPLSRTTWNAGAPTGWTDSGTSSYTSTFACSGSNGGRMDDAGDFYQVFFSSAPDQLSYTIKISGSATSTLLVEESPNGTNWTTVNNHTSIATSCTNFNFSLLCSTRYVRWTYNKTSQNLTIDDVSITSGTPCVLCSGCSVEDAGLTSVSCNNNGTNDITTDDIITFSLNPTGCDLSATYNVSVSSGSISPNTGISYGVATSFTMNTGSAGAGNVTVTITDASGSGCFIDVIVADPGTCSSISTGYNTPGIIVNEFSNGNSGTKEYMEFLVVGEPCTTVDLRGWIFDDNNGPDDATCEGFSTQFSNAGIAGGYVRFRNIARWSAVPVGALILVYNNADKNTSISLADDPTDSNADLVYVLPISDNGFEEATARPNSSNDCSYFPATFATPATWNPIGLRNTGDAAQTRRPDGTYFHGFAYGDASSNMTGGPDNLFFSESGTGRVYYLNCGHHSFITDYSAGPVASDETPGTPNNSLNQELVDYYRGVGGCGVTPPCVVILSETEVKLTGKANHKVNDLYWNTDEHLLAHSFIIEKSSDNNTFTPLQEVANRGVSRYSMSDFTPYATTYYRVAVVQKNGDVSYSNTIVLTNKTKAGGFSVNDIHPNPANTAFSFQFELAERGASVAFKMYNILGELVEYKELSSSQIITLQTDNLESGIYYLVFSSETEQQSHKLLIQH